MWSRAPERLNKAWDEIVLWLIYKMKCDSSQQGPEQKIELEAWSYNK